MALVKTLFLQNFHLKVSIKSFTKTVSVKKSVCFENDDRLDRERSYLRIVKFELLNQKKVANFPNAAIADKVSNRNFRLKAA